VSRPYAQFSGTGRSIPSKILTNHDFSKMGLDTSHEWIIERTGIAERHIAQDGETTCSMAVGAARGAMQRAQVQPDELDVIVLSTATPDRLLPSTAVDIQAELGAARASAFDLSAACSGWLYGLVVAEGLILNGTAETVLVIGAEKMSAIVDWTDRSTCVVFGDGAGAAILQKSRKNKGILSSYMRSDGTLAELLFRPAGGATLPMSEAVLTDRTHLVKMAGREVFRAAVRSMSEAADRALEAANLTGRDIDMLIPHQANVRIIEATAKHADIPMDKVYVNVDRFGNTSSASIPIALDEALERGQIGEGATVLMVTFGAGFTWASMVVRF